PNAPSRLCPLCVIIPHRNLPPENLISGNRNRNKGKKNRRNTSKNIARVTRANVLQQALNLTQATEFLLLPPLGARNALYPSLLTSHVGNNDQLLARTNGIERHTTLFLYSVRPHPKPHRREVTHGTSQ